MKKQDQVIEVPGGLITTEPVKRPSLLTWLNVAWRAMAVLPFGTAVGPQVIVIWNADHTTILHREGPFRYYALDRVIQEFVDGSKVDGIEAYLVVREKAQKSSAE